MNRYMIVFSLTSENLVTARWQQQIYAIGKQNAEDAARAMAVAYGAHVESVEIG